MPKKIITILLVICLSVVTLVGCGAKTNTSSNADNSLDRVKKAGQMVIGIDNTYPPMEFKDKTTGTNKGFDIDVANAVGKKLGVKVKFVPNAWDGIFLALKSKKFDLVQSSVSITDDRKKTMIFTDPYIYGGNAIFVKSDNTTVKSDKDFPGKVIGCQAGTTAQDVLSKLSGLKEVKKYEAMTDAFLDLQNGRTAAVVTDPMVGDYYNITAPGKFKKLKSSLTKEPIGVAFRKEDKGLRDAYNKAMNELKKDGTLSKLSKKWFGLDIYAE
ncbi:MULTISPECIES: ABC transporter substrate-binding protein [Clostridium]|uniref:ABC transporter substrate-binding protein n=1 Tax=Clostridium TaxID=1485 RepID=UPI00069D560C|nr:MULTISPECIES: ABC transporter substrate-binding protein [Clostridium]KOF56577.1 amino acid ABC transporter substrate-binding protein [Clostridium sp. DMHC 10]MCD2346428.1 ABC transporter substrate-binding protein [Clostridium guangxiense]